MNTLHKHSPPGCLRAGRRDFFECLDVMSASLHIGRHMAQLPITIRKHWFGYVLIAVTALLIITITTLGFLELIEASVIDGRVAFGIASLIVVMTAAIAIIQIYVYSLSRMVLTYDGVEIQNWLTLFLSRDEAFEWVRVSRVTATKPAIFAQLLDYGTVHIETNGGHVPASFSWTPDADGVQRIMQRYADAATPDGSLPLDA